MAIALAGEPIPAGVPPLLFPRDPSPPSLQSNDLIRTDRSCTASTARLPSRRHAYVLRGSRLTDGTVRGLCLPQSGQTWLLSSLMSVGLPLVINHKPLITHASGAPPLYTHRETPTQKHCQRHTTHAATDCSSMVYLHTHHFPLPIYPPTTIQTGLRAVLTPWRVRLALLGCKWDHVGIGCCDWACPPFSAPNIPRLPVGAFPGDRADRASCAALCARLAGLPLLRGAGAGGGGGGTLTAPSSALPLPACAVGCFALLAALTGFVCGGLTFLASLPASYGHGLPPD